MVKKVAKRTTSTNWLLFGSVSYGSYNMLKRLEKNTGAEGETRTRTGLLPLDPEARMWYFINWLDLYNYLIFKEFAIIRKSNIWSQFGHKNLSGNKAGIDSENENHSSQTAGIYTGVTEEEERETINNLYE